MPIDHRLPHVHVEAVLAGGDVLYQLTAAKLDAIVAGRSGVVDAGPRFGGRRLCKTSCFAYKKKSKTKVEFSFAKTLAFSGLPYFIAW